LAFIICGSI